ncbi:antA/AntB antirepressor family protein [Avibacterium paragallinarum]|uniref:Phage anti-repressor protein n=1 Tax=Avibacterium paragallinarum TaxID=728 RepID=A0A380X649_AVIPA|nr:antA/AntB antirepressor family protein [Avibacterium paragallinarum]SUU98722.1 Phage anti-repressor protein [Avibacterium paragallinarum]SUV40777.1 Phage anti-repressor protein [Avibacterium paragallinarum]
MTNSNLIPVFNGLIANQTVQLCNARELHQFVESKREYATWIKDRITDYGFVQDEDYIIVTERTNGRPRKEYHITLDMGKELAMVERNEKGRQVRKYFIECERRALQPQDNELLQLLMRIYCYGTQYADYQRAALGTAHNDFIGKSKLIGDFCTEGEPAQKGFLFVFTPNIEQDLQQAREIINRHVHAQHKTRSEF